ncbi:alpha/beta hydrolase family esterase [Actinokineospora iranica]|uniref:Poly(3-hydroxybutyrate) depolymerase n=1 Tax=Actinokineospora iranica TaxID=1271860 RepID=A0A1G6WYF9_9PSEU|nr:hypothetical protein [Actinokineospora iranica]SDD70871.1 Poly(3-hydroxybutyrate) depolymerase [Actinokineospora iranica]
MHRLIVALVMLSLLVVPAPVSAAEPCAPPGDHTEQEWPVVQRKADGTLVSRAYRAHVPPHQTGALVLDLHGAMSNKDEQDRRSQMRAKSDAEGFVVIQPNSLPNWITSPQEEAKRGVSDFEFVRTLLEFAVRRMCVSPDAIYSVGFSSGGLMSTMLACAGAEGRLGGFRLAGVGAVASAPLPMPTGRICPALAEHPVPLRIVFSDNDSLLAHCCRNNLAKMVTAVHDAARLWAADNGCIPFSTVAETGKTGPGVRKRTTRHHCLLRRGEVLVDVVDSGSVFRDGHFWPGPPNRDDYDATAALWWFLRP